MSSSAEFFRNGEVVPLRKTNNNLRQKNEYANEDYRLHVFLFYERVRKYFFNHIHRTDIQFYVVIVVRQKITGKFIDSFFGMSLCVDVNWVAKVWVCEFSVNCV